MLKKIALTIIILFILLVLGLLSPWNNINFSFSRILGFGAIQRNAGLKVYPLVGEMDVYLDNKFIDSKDPSNGPIEISEIKPGIHNVRLTRKSSPDGAYIEFNRSIKFEKNVDVIISYELGPTSKFSEGHVFSAEKKFGDSSTTLNVISTPDRASLYIDNKFIGETPISSIDIKLTSKHSIKLEKKGYESIGFDILPESQDERNKLKGYELNLETNMFLPPFQLIDKSKNGSN